MVSQANMFNVFKGIAFKGIAFKGFCLSGFLSSVSIGSISLPGTLPIESMNQASLVADNNGNTGLEESAIGLLSLGVDFHIGKNQPTGSHPILMGDLTQHYAVPMRGIDLPTPTVRNIPATKATPSAVLSPFAELESGSVQGYTFAESSEDPVKARRTNERLAGWGWVDHRNQPKITASDWLLNLQPQLNPVPLPGGVMMAVVGFACLGLGRAVMKKKR